MSFLPTNYSVPSSSDKYYKFKQGSNQFRIMSSPVLGYEYWVDNEGGRKPVRYHMNESLDMSVGIDPETVKHFWAMVVWDYEAEKAKILEITQKGIQQSLTVLAKDSDWGSPVGNDGYDILVTKSGDGLETKYETQPKPHKKLPEGVEQFVKDLNINLEALFKGEDPFINETKK